MPRPTAISHQELGGRDLILGHAAQDDDPRWLG
jgi:hypothetical protein